VNVQFLTAPYGELIRPPGATHPARDRPSPVAIVVGLTARAIACYADKGYIGAGGAIGKPFRQPEGLAGKRARERATQTAPAPASPDAPSKAPRPTAGPKRPTNLPPPTQTEASKDD
jgi:hypothetical protein